jgi:hypothetical protein
MEMEKQLEMAQSGKSWCTWSRFFSVVLLVCMVLNLVPVAGQNTAKPMLYKVTYTTKDHTETPYRAKTDGPIVGEVLKSQVYEVITFEGDWAKIKHRGGEYYLYKKRLEKVDKPDVVASPWAKEWF